MLCRLRLHYAGLYAKSARCTYCALPIFATFFLFFKKSLTPLLEVLWTHYSPSFLSSSRNQERILEYLVWENQIWKKVDTLCKRAHDGRPNLTAYVEVAPRNNKLEYRGSRHRERNLGRCPTQEVLHNRFNFEILEQSKDRNYILLLEYDFFVVNNIFYNYEFGAFLNLLETKNIFWLSSILMC